MLEGTLVVNENIQFGYLLASIHQLESLNRSRLSGWCSSTINIGVSKTFRVIVEGPEPIVEVE